MTKKHYPGTDLDRKIPKSADKKESKEIKKRNFEQLCTYYGLEAEKFDQNDPNPWRKLCVSIIKHRIPGFQKSKSGNKRRNTLASDYEIYREYAPLLKGEYEFGFKSASEWLAKKYTKQEREKIAAKAIGCRADKVRGAVRRIERFLKKYPNGLYHVDPAEFHNESDMYYASAEIASDCNTRNVKNSTK